MVEQLTLNQRVVGSSPTRFTIILLLLKFLRMFILLLVYPEWLYE